MSDLSQDFNDAEPLPDPAGTPAPDLPIEAPFARTVLALNEMRRLSVDLLVLLQNAPTQSEAFYRLHAEIWNAWAAADDGYRHYLAVKNCKGQC